MATLAAGDTFIKLTTSQIGTTTVHRLPLIELLPIELTCSQDPPQEHGTQNDPRTNSS